MPIANAEYLNLRCFLEGIEVPVISAIVSASAGQASSCTIEIPPDDRVFLFAPRTTVHVFYYDQYAAKERIGNQGVSSLYDIPPVDASFMGDTSPYGGKDEDYKLLFMGEIFSISLSKQGFGTRNNILTCMDFSNTLDTSYVYQIQYSHPETGGIINKTDNFIGAEGNPFDDIVSQPELEIRNLVRKNKALNPSLSGTGDLMGGLLRILEGLLGVQGRNFGVNLWVTIQERRVRLMDQLASDSGKVAAELFDREVFQDWLNNSIQHGGPVISFRDLLNIIMQYTYYRHNTITSPQYISGKRDTPKYASEAEGGKAPKEFKPFFTSKGWNQSGGMNAEFFTLVIEVVKALQAKNVYGDAFPGAKIHQGYRSFHARVNVEMQKGKSRAAAEARASNIRSDESLAKQYAHDFGFAIDLTSGGSLSMGFIWQPAWITVKGKKVPNRAGVWSALSTFVASYTPSPTTPTALWTSLRAYCAAGGKVNDQKGNLQISSSNVEKIIKGFQYHAAFFTKLQKIASASGEVWSGKLNYLGAASKTKDTFWGLWGLGGDVVHLEMLDWWGKRSEGTIGNNEGKTITKKSERERLISHVFCPDLWMCAPPKCNMLFPWEIQGININRQMMRETTRLRLTTYNKLYQNSIVNQRYYAPVFTDTENLKSVGIGGTNRSVVYPHEKFSGIIPKLETMSEAAFFAKMDEDSVTKFRDSGYESGTSNLKNVLDTYGSAVAHYNLLTNRYDSRTGSVTAHFSPRIVCGFPIVLISSIGNELAHQRKLVAEEAKDQLSDEAYQALISNDPIGQKIIDAATPISWIAMVDSISHSISQGGATTSITLSKVRSHKSTDLTDDLLSTHVNPKSATFTLQTGRSVTKISNSKTHNIQLAFTTKVYSAGDNGIGDILLYFLAANGFYCPSSVANWSPGSDARFVESRNPAMAIGTPVLRVLSSITTGPTIEDPGDLIDSVFYQDLSAKDIVWDSTSPALNAKLLARTLKYTYSSKDILSVEPSAGTFTRVEDVFYSSSDRTLLGGFVLTFDFFWEDTTINLIDAISSGQVDNLQFHGSKSAVALAMKSDWAQFNEISVNAISSIVSAKIRVIPERANMVISTGKVSVKKFSGGMPLEEAIRPPWFSEEYSNANIGSLYQEWLGCSSILDGVKKSKNETVTSIETAVNFYAGTSANLTSETQETYSSSLTFRPIATIPDVLQPADNVSDANKYNAPSSGGFHAACFGEYDKLELLDLVNKNLKGPTGRDSVKITAAAKYSRLDPRKDRRERVKNYVKSMSYRGKYE